MPAAKPRLSIVTAVLDRASMIRDAIESVLQQDLEESDFEHIVIDGGSTDGTLEVLAQYPHLRVVSEPDDGVYDAMNKGIKAARGEFIGLLNSDDRYLPGSLPAALKAISPETDMIVGGAVVVEDTRRCRPVASYPPPERGLDIVQLTRGVPITNARFIRRSVFADIGGFDIGLRLTADREWLVRAWIAELPVTVIRDPLYVYEYRQHSGSLTIGSGIDQSVMKRESLEICRRLLKAADGSGELRSAVREWQAKIVAVSVRKQLRGRSVAAAIREGVTHASEDPLWPIRAARQRFGRL